MGGRVAGKVAVVVGAGVIDEGWGIGRAVAALYAREGAKVFAVDVDHEKAIKTRDVIRAEGGVCEAHQVDATSSASVKAMVDACVTAYGRIDILHNNVGISSVGGLLDLPEETWNRDIAVNLTSAFLTCRHAVPVMLKGGGGAIVNTASVMGVRYFYRPVLGYATAKAGVIQLTRWIAVEFLEKGIRANCVVPGVIDTPRARWRMKNIWNMSDDEIEQGAADRAKQAPGGKLGNAWDIANAALYLASDEARYVTGTELVVDGGLLARS